MSARCAGRQYDDADVCWFDTSLRELDGDAPDFRKRKPTPTIRHGPVLSMLRAIVGVAVHNGRDRVLL